MKIKISLLLLLLFTLNGISQNNYTKIDQYIDNQNLQLADIENLFTLLDAIDDKFPNEKDKVRGIHKIIINLLSYDYNKLNFINNHSESDAYGIKYGRSEIEQLRYVIKNKKGVCHDYSKLFEFLGGYLNLDISYVNGFVKKYKSSLEKELEIFEHAWNCVNIGGEDYFVDVTWSDNILEESIDNYFLVPPEKMIFSHFPENPDFQMLTKKISLNNFKNMPYVYPIFNKKEQIIKYSSDANGWF